MNPADRMAIPIIVVLGTGGTPRSVQGGSDVHRELARNVLSRFRLFLLMNRSDKMQEGGECVILLSSLGYPNQIFDKPIRGMKLHGKKSILEIEN